MESGFPNRQPQGLPYLRLQLLGPVAVIRHGVPLPLPASRKARALLGYLALAPRPVSRGRLCELLWDIPNDPRGELRWCLSKLRRLVDDADRTRLLTRGDTIGLDLADCQVDALDIARAMAQGVGSFDAAQLRTLLPQFGGELLEGLELDRCPQFDAWLTSERHRVRGRMIAVLEHLAGLAPDDESFGHLEIWRNLAPFDARAHQMLLDRLARQGRLAEGDAHVAATARVYEAEGLDAAPIREGWRKLRQRGSPTPASEPRSGVTALLPVLAQGTERPSGRASVAVMPFLEAAGDPRGFASWLAHDVISGLARLRSLFVIAQGTVFVLQSRGVGPDEAGRMLNVDYVLTGSVLQRLTRLRISVELVETRTARIVWSEAFDHALDDTLLMLDELGQRIVAAIAGEIEQAERNRALLKPPDSLDAWEAYHRGLWHMYRFARTDNRHAARFFEMAVKLDPTFAPAHAGLSFTHFQNAFQNWAPRGAEVERAYATAAQGLMADDRDPTAHWAMGRALWLRGQQEESVAELQRSVALSPNFALGHYALAFVRSQAGDARAAIEAADHARSLSPFDPLLFAMLAARAMALVRLGEFAAAADWAVRAAARPNAHPHIVAIAACSLALAGSLEQARAHLAAIRRQLPGYHLADLLEAFRYDERGALLFRQGASLIGMV